MARTPKAPKAKMGRTYASDVQLQLGLLNITGNFCSVRKSESSNTKTVTGEKLAFESACPSCYDGDSSFSSLSQVYLCDTDKDHGPFERADALKAINGKVIGTSEEVLGAAKEETPEDVKPTMNLMVHYADEVEQHTVFTGAAYAFHPNVRNPLYPIMIERIGPNGEITVPNDSRPMVMVGEVVLRGKPKLFQLRRWNGHLLLQEIARPEDMYEMDQPGEAVDDRFVDPFLTFVETARIDFEPASYEDNARKKLAEFAEQRLGVDKPLLEVLAGGGQDVPVAPADDALLAMLTASVDAAKAKKAS